MRFLTQTLLFWYSVEMVFLFLIFMVPSLRELSRFLCRWSLVIEEKTRSKVVLMSKHSPLHWCQVCCLSISLFRQLFCFTSCPRRISCHGKVGPHCHWIMPCLVSSEAFWHQGVWFWHYFSLLMLPCVNPKKFKKDFSIFLGSCHFVLICHFWHEYTFWGKKFRFLLH